MNERSAKQRETEADQRKTHLESHEAERKMTRKNEWNAADGFNVAGLGSSTWMNATEIYWSANCSPPSPPSLFTDFHLPLICMRVAKCMIYVEPEWKMMTLLIDKKRIAGMKMAFQSFFCLSFTPTFISLHSFVRLLSPPCFSHVLAILVLFHLCQIDYFTQCVPPPPPTPTVLTSLLTECN